MPEWQSIEFVLPQNAQTFAENFQIYNMHIFKYIHKSLEKVFLCRRYSLEKV